MGRKKSATAVAKDESASSGVGLLVFTTVVGVGAGVGLYFWNRLKRRKASPQSRRCSKGVAMTHEQLDVLEGYKSKCTMSKDQLNALVDDFLRRMNEGLRSEGQMLKQLPSYVEKMPNGEEAGEFLAIDLGGTNVRVVKVVLEDRKVKEVVAHEDAIPKALMRGTTKGLFDFIAKQVKLFMARHSARPTASGTKVPIGFTFSYPMKQTGIKNGELICWTKGFDIKDTLGKDLVGLLEASMREQEVEGEVFAILNDTVGTLAASRFADQDTQLGVILGTGSNAAYIESKGNISKLRAGGSDGGRMIVNIEWGNFKSDHLPYLAEDREIDEGTPNRGSQHYEKMISGMYLGEMARRACLRASREANLFGGTQRRRLEKLWSFPTSLVSEIDGLGSGRLPQVKKALSKALDIPEASVSDGCAHFVTEVCRLIGDRSATLAAAGVAAIYRYLTQSGQVALDQRFVVAVDGGLFEHYPRYKDRMDKTFGDLLGGQAKRVELVHSPDGSGIGSAVIAAAAATSR